MVSQSFSAARLNQGKFMLRTRSRRNKRSIELAKEGIPLPLGNRFWASNWPTGKAPLTGMIIHFIPAVRLRAGYEELQVLTPIVAQIVIILAAPPSLAYPFIIDITGYPQQVVNFFVVVASISIIQAHFGTQLGMALPGSILAEVV